MNAGNDQCLQRNEKVVLTVTSGCDEDGACAEDEGGGGRGGEKLLTACDVDFDPVLLAVPEGLPASRR